MNHKSQVIRCGKIKIELYWSIIRPITTYPCGTWLLKGTVENKESVTKDFWSYIRKRRYMENQIND